METSEDYWQEAVASSLEAHGISFNAQQLTSIAGDMVTSHEQYSMAFPVPEHPSVQEAAVLRARLDRASTARACTLCNGTGRSVLHGPYHSSETDCWNCKGSGLVHFDQH